LKTLASGFACLILAVSAQPQAPSSTPTLKPRPTSPAAAAPAPEQSTVPPDAPVITVRGYCDKPAGGSATPSDCKTVVTRAEFEKMLPPNTPPANRKRMADGYLQLLAFAEKGHELGLDQGSDFDQQMHLVRMKILAQLAFQQMQKAAANIPESEIEAYYRDHAAEYKAATFDRIYVPKQKQSDLAALKPNDPDAQKKREASEAEMKKEADKLRERAAAGEDFAKLQQEAYDFAGQKITAANTKTESVRKSGLPAAVSALKPSELSQVVNEPAGFMVYRLDELKDLPLASVRDEIARVLQNERMQKERESLENAAKASTTLDESYFATPAPPSLKKPGEVSTAPAPNPDKKE
jgi:hypothetical protein